jgi:uncharacterized membrane protein YhaH (DUF805 family)
MNLLFGFSGRIGRLKWWLAQLAGGGVIILGVVLIVISVGAHRVAADSELKDFPASALLIIIATLALAIWINAACSVKRFHDRNKSGAWFFIVFVPYIGTLWQTVECGFLAGTPGDNNYGPPPGSRSFEDIEEEVRTTYGAPAGRPASLTQATPAVTMQRATGTVPARRSVPATGFGRRGAS